MRETRTEAEEHSLGLIDMDLVCLGDTKKLKVGAARIKTDDLNWRKKIDLLLEDSMGILIVPGPTGSIIEEIVKIYSDDALLAKSVFIMAPKITGSWYDAFWDVVLLDKLKKNGIEFPKHINEGLIFNAHGTSIALKGYHLRSPIDFAINIMNIRENKI